MNLKISLAAARVNANYTQTDVANIMHVSKKTVVDWEKGRTEPKVSQAMELSALYNIPIDNIFLPSNPTKSEIRKKTP